MIKEIIIKCDDEQARAHEAWLEEQREVLETLEKMMAADINPIMRNELHNIYSFIKRGEM